MGLFFTLIYILTAYVAPETLFGTLAQFHVEIALAFATLLASLFSLRDTGLLRMPQTYAWFGLLLAVICSIAFNGWLGGGAKAMLEYLPGAMPFFFVVVNCKKKSHIQAVVLVLLAAGLFNVSQGLRALVDNDYTSRYIMRAIVDVGVYVGRIRGLDFINDPNDLAQVLVTLLPLMFLFWVKGNWIRNLFFVLVPVSCLIVGTYFTHSRGGMLALLVVGALAARKKIGILPAAGIGCLLFVGFIAIGWTGGRSVSAAAGDDRVSAWSAGIGLIRAHPVFGVGFQKFPDYYEITAHNTIVVCAAEIGIIGLFFWVLFMLPTLRDVYLGSINPAQKAIDDEKALAKRLGVAYIRPTPGLAGIASSASSQLATAAPIDIRPGTLFLEPERAFAEPARAFAEPSGAAAVLRPTPIFQPAVPDTQAADAADSRWVMNLFVLSIAGFLTSAWFLSRAYTMTLFILVGLSEAATRIARTRGVAPPQLSLARTMRLSAVLGISVLVFLYCLVVFDHLFLRSK